MKYTGCVKGDVVILKPPLPVPDGTEVEIFMPPGKEDRNTTRAKSRLTQETFGMIGAEPALVRAVLAEEWYEA